MSVEQRSERRRIFKAANVAVLGGVIAASAGYLGGSFEVFSLGAGATALGLGVRTAGRRETVLESTRQEQKPQEAPLF